jgi:hypothetical protein
MTPQKRTITPSVTMTDFHGTPARMTTLPPFTSADVGLLNTWPQTPRQSELTMRHATGAGADARIRVVSSVNLISVPRWGPGLFFAASG